MNVFSGQFLPLLKTRSLSLAINRVLLHRRLATPMAEKTSADPRHPQSAIGDEIVEGKARISAGPNVFYNPVQQFNRDLTIAVITQFVRQRIGDDDKFAGLKIGERVEGGIRILEPLAATGLRAIRFALEVPGVEEVTANDLSHEAVTLLSQNIKMNNVENMFKVREDDAVAVMFESRPTNMVRRYDVIDIDPFGTPAPFLDSAVQAVADGGLLCITATDAAILCGKHVETCHATYGSVGLNAAPFCHEMGIRILLRSIEAHANRYSRSIEPVVALSADFYMRVFVRVHSGAKRAKLSVTRLSLVHRCIGCGTFQLQQLANVVDVEKDKFNPCIGNYPPEKCPNCGWRFQMGGPIWSDATCDKSFLKGVAQLTSTDGPLSNLATRTRIEGTIALLQEELPDCPLFYVVDRLSGVLHCQSPPSLAFRSAILNGGYRVSLSHADRSSIKTDAPSAFIWDILRAWEKTKPVNEKRRSEVSPGNAILAKPITSEISFDHHPDAEPPSRKAGLVRWEIAPPFWGPGSKKPNKVKLGESDNDNGNSTSANQDSKKARTTNDDT